MSKVFRAWDVDEVWLFPASVQDFVPPGHIAHLIRETVREGLNLRAILSHYDEERGYPPYHPGMMTARSASCASGIWGRYRVCLYKSSGCAAKRVWSSSAMSRSTAPRLRRMPPSTRR